MIWCVLGDGGFHPNRKEGIGATLVHSNHKEEDVKQQNHGDVKNAEEEVLFSSSLFSHFRFFLGLANGVLSESGSHMFAILFSW